MIYNCKRQKGMMKRKLLTISILLYTFFSMAQTKVIAHRGYWNTKGSAQNSITALLKADSLGIYGSEFDVRVSKDSVLIINHDSDLWGYNIAKSDAKTLTTIQLKNKETMPTLTDYFEAARPLSIQLILELKNLASPEIETYAVAQIIKQIEEYGYNNRVEFISFSLHAVKEMIKQAPHIPTYYLGGELSPKELKDLGCTGLDYHFSVFKKNPQWISESHQLGLKVNCWTVNKEAEMKKLIHQGVDFITTDEPQLLRDLLKNTLK